MTSRQPQRDDDPAVPGRPVGAEVLLVPDPAGPVLGGPDEAAWVAAAQAGSAFATDRLFAEIRPLVVRYVRSRLRDGAGRAAADDVVQDVCVSVLRALPAYEDRGRPFMAFVHRVAAYRVTDVGRDLRRSRVDPGVRSDDEWFAGTIADPGPEPEDAAVRAELGRTLRAVLAELPDAQRKILVLRVALGFSAEHAARIIGSTAGAVRVAQNRALTALRASFPDPAAALLR